jgi:hypothetical protein
MKLDFCVSHYYTQRNLTILRRGRRRRRRRRRRFLWV